MRDEPAAVGVIKSCLAGGEWELLAARIREMAARLGYDLLEVLDADTVADLRLEVRDLDVDAVITPTTEHLILATLTRLCEVITLTPPETYSRNGHHEPLGDYYRDPDEPSRLRVSSLTAAASDSAEVPASGTE